MLLVPASLSCSPSFIKCLALICCMNSYSLSCCSNSLILFCLIFISSISIMFFVLTFIICPWLPFIWKTIFDGNVIYLQLLLTVDSNCELSSPGWGNLVTIKLLSFTLCLVCQHVRSRPFPICCASHCGKVIISCCECGCLPWGHLILLMIFNHAIIGSWCHKQQMLPFQD